MKLTLARNIQGAITRGVARDRTEVARRLDLTRAQVTQLMGLTLLTPDIQEQILIAESPDGVEPRSELELRSRAIPGSWNNQRGISPEKR